MMHKVRLNTRYFLLDSNIWCVCEYPKPNIETLKCDHCQFRTKIKKDNSVLPDNYLFVNDAVNR